MGKKLLIFLSVVLAAVLSGCSVVSIDNSELMRPPKATGDKAEIQQVIDDVAGDAYILKYPQSGDHRSAITMRDLNNDGVQEAIAFYQLKNTQTPATEILIIAERNDVWTAVGHFENQSTEINRIAFGDLTGNGNLDVIAGWGAYSSSTNQITAYSYTENGTSEIFINETYTSFVVGDFTGDNSDEILLLSLAPADNAAKPLAKLMDWKNDTGSLAVMANTFLDPEIAKFSQVKSSKLNAAQEAAFVDGTTALGTYNTQVIYYDTNKSILKNSLYSTTHPNPTARPAAVFCTMFNDTNIEVPTCTVMSYGQEEDESTVAVITTWNLYDDQTDTLTPKSNMIVDTTYNYSFALSERWNSETVTARINANDKTLTFYHWNSEDEKGSRGDKLLTVKVFPREQWMTLGSPEGYLLIEKTSSYAYAYALAETDNELKLTEDEVVNAFSLLNTYTASASTSSSGNTSSSSSQ